MEEILSVIPFSGKCHRVHLSVVDHGMSLSDTDKRLFQKAGKVMMTLRFEDLTHRIAVHRTVSAYLHICSTHRVQQERLLSMFRQMHHILVRS